MLLNELVSVHFDNLVFRLQHVRQYFNARCTSFVREFRTAADWTKKNMFLKISGFASDIHKKVGRF